MIARFAILIPAFALTVLLACSESPEPQPAPTARPTATPTAVPTLVPTPTPIISFENSLTGADLSKFIGLPAEFQDALIAESKETGNDRTLEYLHDLPDDAVQIADLFSIFQARRNSAFFGPSNRLGVQDMYKWLEPDEQRRLLLEGYPNASYQYLEEEWRAGDLNVTDIQYRFGRFEHMVKAVYGTLTREGELLPPPEETLSQSAKDKLDSLNPMLNESFRLMWGNTRLHDMIDPAAKLESWLLNMPLEMPGVNSLGCHPRS
jgi:hypothetical protein